MNHVKLGELGETAAAKYLEAKGYCIIARRYRSRIGEIDIIAKQSTGTLVFIEVKTRSSTAYGLPSEAVTCRKQQKIIRTALVYLQQNYQTNISCRFDVIEIQVDRNKEFKIHHITNAFSV